MEDLKREAMEIIERERERARKAGHIPKLADDVKIMAHFMELWNLQEKYIPYSTEWIHVRNAFSVAMGVIHHSYLHCDKSVKHRQLWRAYSIIRDEVYENAFRQLSSALIVHYREAWARLKWELKALISLKCSVCGKRHLGPKDFKEGTYEMFCAYGLKHTVRHVFRMTYLAAMHGED